MNGEELEAHVHLGGAGGQFVATREAWGSALQLAIDHEWKPACMPTLYGSDVGLEVSDDDATAFANALQGALDGLSGDKDDDEPSVDASRLTRERIAELIAFCQPGGFRIC